MTGENLLRVTASQKEDSLSGEVEPAVDTLLSLHVFLDHLNFHWCEGIPRKGWREGGKGREKEKKEREEGHSIKKKKKITESLVMICMVKFKSPPRKIQATKPFFFLFLLKVTSLSL